MPVTLRPSTELHADYAGGFSGAGERMFNIRLSDLSVQNQLTARALIEKLEKAQEIISQAENNGASVTFNDLGLDFENGRKMIAMDHFYPVISIGSQALFSHPHRWPKELLDLHQMIEDCAQEKGIQR